MTSNEKRFIVCFPAAVSAALLAWLALAQIPTVGSWLIAGMPNFFVVVLCGLVGLLCYLNRPRPLTMTRAAAATVVCYVALLIVFLMNPSIWGEHHLKVRVLDWEHRPIEGIPVEFMTQQHSLGLFENLVPKVSYSFVTDAKGEFVVRTNQYLANSLRANSEAHAANKREEYRQAGAELIPGRGGATRALYYWSNRRQDELSNEHQYESTFQYGSAPILTIFLPTISGDDANPYKSYTGDVKPWQKEQNEVLQRLRAGHKGVPIAIERNITLNKGGAPRDFNLAGATGSDVLRFEAWTHDEKSDVNDNTPYAWKFRISVPGGGITEGHGEFGFVAPSDGYGSSAEMGRSATEGAQWRSSDHRPYFARFPDGRYAQLQIEMIAGGDNFVVVRARLNTAPEDRYFGSEAKPADARSQ